MAKTQQPAQKKEETPMQVDVKINSLDNQWQENKTQKELETIHKLNERLEKLLKQLGAGHQGRDPAHEDDT